MDIADENLGKKVGKYLRTNVAEVKHRFYS